MSLFQGDEAAKDRFFKFVDFDTGACCCMRWKGYKTHDGYGRFRFRGKLYLAHVMSLSEEMNEAPNGRLVLHRTNGGVCKFRDCVNPKHLYFGTASDNMQDAIRDGTHRHPKPMPGSDNPNSKLTEKTVREIFSAQGAHREIAKKYRVSQSLVSDIKSGKRWAHLNLIGKDGEE